jgi:hypothetical protein
MPTWDQAKAIFAKPNSIVRELLLERFKARIKEGEAEAIKIVLDLSDPQFDKELSRSTWVPESLLARAASDLNRASLDQALVSCLA